MRFFLWQAFPTGEPSLKDGLAIIQPEAATVFSADTWNAAKLNLDAIDVKEIFIKSSCKVHSSVKIMSNILRSSV